MAVQILGRDSSYNVQKVLWLARELALPVKHVQVGGRHGGTESSAFVALNPMQKVPVLVDQGRTVWESNSILRYLADTYGLGSWRVTEPYQRSEHERWMDWAQCQFEPAFVGVFWGYYRAPEGERDGRAIDESVNACEACLSALDRQLGAKTYLLGEQPTLADICCGVFLYRLAEVELQVGFPPSVVAWYKKLKTRPAYQQEVMRDFSELAGRLAY